MGVTLRERLLAARRPTGTRRDRCPAPATGTPIVFTQRAASLPSRPCGSVGTTRARRVLMLYTPGRPHRCLVKYALKELLAGSRQPDPQAAESAEGSALGLLEARVYLQVEVGV